MSKKKKTQKAMAQKAAKRAMKRHKTESARRKKSHAVMSTNAVQQQMLGQFGNAENFMRNISVLSDMFAAEPELQKLRFDHNDLYSKLDATDRETNEALADFYDDENYLIYSEDFEGFWRDRRQEMLPDLITDEFVSQVGKTFDILEQKKKGKKKEYRASLAGKLLVESHAAALTEADIEDNNLWELIFNATLKDNKIELPELPDEPEEPPESEESEGAVEDQGDAETAADAEPAPEKSEEPQVKPESDPEPEDAGVDSDKE